MYLVINKWVIAVDVSYFSGQYLRNHWTLDICVLGYIGIVWPKEHSPEVWSVPPVTPCIHVLHGATNMFLLHSTTWRAKHQELTTRKIHIYIAHSVRYHKANNLFNTKKNLRCCIIHTYCLLRTSYVFRRYYLDIFRMLTKMSFKIHSNKLGHNKYTYTLRGLSPQANYTDRAATAGRRS